MGWGTRFTERRCFAACKERGHPAHKAIGNDGESKVSGEPCRPGSCGNGLDSKGMPPRGNGMRGPRMRGRPACTFEANADVTESIPTRYRPWSGSQNQRVTHFRMETIHSYPRLAYTAPCAAVGSQLARHCSRKNEQTLVPVLRISSFRTLFRATSQTPHPK